jgi:hypothetical protein
VIKAKRIAHLPLAAEDHMAEHTHSGPAELGAPMDYAQHDQTFASFVMLTKLTILATIDVLLALALYGFGSGGFWLGTLLIMLMMIATAISLMAKGTMKPLIVVTIIGVVFVVLSVG